MFLIFWDQTIFLAKFELNSNINSTSKQRQCYVMGFDTFEINLLWTNNWAVYSAQDVFC